ncbi:hypothetical protein [Bacillus sp. AFS017336]|uniref:hypothetical protein n=1 Tax=Bacillus sp. AFS017336 TaxID=2033489 RepID=UPI000BF1995A|nr:hypothetical protein [Bacillus sp. AFS017336]PEL07608.1 hypothetical protein CN601_19375 [Bacillus sp. AFS017336]
MIEHDLDMEGPFQNRADALCTKPTAYEQISVLYAQNTQQYEQKPPLYAQITSLSTKYTSSSVKL